MTKPTLLFIGDSLIADFDWQARMPHFKVLNQGLHGETSKGLLERIETGHEKIPDVKAILLMIGTNNLLIEDYNYTEILRKIIVSLTNLYPGTEVIVNSLLPIRVPWIGQEDLAKITANIESITLQTGSCYLDIFSKFINMDGRLFQADGVHLTEQAYDLWAKSILEFIAFLVED